MLRTSSDNSTAPRRVGYSLAVGSCSGPHHTTHMMNSNESTASGSATLDWEATAARATGMTVDQLEWSIADCIEAGKCAFEIELAGYRVGKSQGFYHDEASVYRAEIVSR